MFTHWIKIQSGSGIHTADLDQVKRKFFGKNVHTPLLYYYTVHPQNLEFFLVLWELNGGNWKEKYFIHPTNSTQLNDDNNDDDPNLRIIMPELSLSFQFTTISLSNEKRRYYFAQNGNGFSYLIRWVWWCRYRIHGRNKTKPNQAKPLNRYDDKGYSGKFLQTNFVFWKHL